MLSVKAVFRTSHLLIERGGGENSKPSVFTDREAAVVLVEARA